MPPATPTIAAVVFDLDGLLVNTEDLYQDVGTELLRRRGRTFDGDLLDAMMGRPQAVALATMIDWHGLADTVEMLAAETKEIFQGLLATRLAPMPGAVVRIVTRNGRGVAMGELLLVLEAMKMEVEVKAPVNATVLEIAVRVGDQVSAGQVLVWLN